MLDISRSSGGYHPVSLLEILNWTPFTSPSPQSGEWRGEDSSWYPAANWIEFSSQFQNKKENLVFSGFVKIFVAMLKLKKTRLQEQKNVTTHNYRSLTIIRGSILRYLSILLYCDNDCDDDVSVEKDKASVKGIPSKKMFLLSLRHREPL